MHNCRAQLLFIRCLMRSNIFLVSILCLIIPSMINDVFASDISTFGASILRYENEKKLDNNKERERLRLIARGGIKYQINESSTFITRISTGLKNKQNVPAITIKRINTQAQPDNDIYLDQIYLKHIRKGVEYRIGRVPWSFGAETDTFWDRDLNPFTAYVKYAINDTHSLSTAFIKPLDGQSQTVGQMFVAQYTFKTQYQNLRFEIQPWLVEYQGELDARFAKRDTQYDHSSVRIAAGVSYQKWRVGLDAGYAFNLDSQIEGEPDLKRQNKSIVSQITYGKLKSVNDWQWHLRYMHVERFAVISEFGQNAIAAKLTSNFRAWDSRFRYRITPSIWVGARLSLSQSLIGDFSESKRFRIEARWAF